MKNYLLPILVVLITLFSVNAKNRSFNITEKFDANSRFLNQTELVSTAYWDACIPPTAQATTFTLTALADNSMTIEWTRGNGDAVLVVAKEAGAIDSDPTDGSGYTANAAFESGDEIGAGNYTVYNGTGTSISLTTLMAGTTYHFAIYEYNTADNCYLAPALIGDATTTNTAPYCVAGSTDPLIGYISQVILKEINQSSGLGLDGYEDYTSQIATMQAGVSSTITINKTTTVTFYNNEFMEVWVDWNQDDDFSDIGENVFTSSTAVSSYVASFTPPANATTGQTRMRIRLDIDLSGSVDSPCGYSTYGEVEDYTINVTPCTPPATPAAAINTQPTCSASTGSINLTNLPASGTWTVTRTPDGTTYSSSGTSTTISDLATGSYTFTVTNAAGCTSASSNSITINAQPETPSAPAVALNSITQPTCTEATGGVYLSGLPSTGQWTLTGTPGAITQIGTGTSDIFSGLTAGTTYNFTVTHGISGCISAASADVVIDDQPAPLTAPTIGTRTHPNCDVTTGSVVLNGLPATGSWTITMSPGDVTTTGTGITKTIEGLVAGTYTFTVTNATACTSPASLDAVINAPPAAPTTPVIGTITQPTCTVATGSIALSGLPATGTWTLIMNPGAVASTGTGTTTTITGLTTGSYTFTVTDGVTTCTSAVSASAVINALLETPDAPTVGLITQPNCTVGTGNVYLSGLPATGLWTLETLPISENTLGSGTSTTITGLSDDATYSFKVTNAAGCVSLPSEDVIIEEQPATPTAPAIGTITQPTCAVATGSIVLNSLPSTGWSITRTPGNVISTGTSTSASLTLLPPGTYTYTLTDNVTGCTSAASAPATINTQPATPSAPNITVTAQPTCSTATGSIYLSGLPSTGWTINPGNITGNTTALPISGLTPGDYSYTLTDDLSGCTSVSSDIETIIVQPTTPSAPVVGAITHPTCAVATGSVELSGLPADWTLTMSPGAITTTGTGATKTIEGLAAGTYTFTVTDDGELSGCTSAATGNVVINAQPATPTAPVIGAITHPTCLTTTGSVVLSGLPAGAWTINPGGITGSTTTTTLTGLAVGTHTFTVTNVDNCTSIASADVVINPQPSVPTAPVIGTITQPTCVLATASVNLTGLPATGIWTLTMSPGSGSILGSGSTYTMTGIPANNTYTFTITNSTGCVSVASANVVVNTLPTAPTTPIVGALTQPDCTTGSGSVALSGLPTGNWTINPGGFEGSGTTTTLEGLEAGIYNFTVSNGPGCTSAPTANVVINPWGSTPATPVIGVITHPSCDVATGSIDLGGLPAGAWNLTMMPGSISTSGTGSTTTITNLASNTYTFIVQNIASGCFSAPSANAVVNAQPTIPSAPVVGTITQPTCLVSTGSVDLSGLPATGIWTLNPGGITGTGTTTTLTGLPLNATYSYTVTNETGCTSSSSTDIVIGAIPSSPNAPVVETIIQPTCLVPSGTVALSGLPAGAWTINPGAVTGTGTTTSIAGLVTGTYNFTVTDNLTGCTSSASADAVINVNIEAPSAPVVGTITQPTCAIATGSVVLSGLPATGQWILARTPFGGFIYGTGTSTIVSGLTAGTYTFVVTNADACTSSSSADVVIETSPATPSAPVVGLITNPTCTVQTGSVALSGLPATGTWIINPGNISGTGTTATISGLAAGTYNFTVSDGTTSCTSVASANVIIADLGATPSAPSISIISQPTCLTTTGSILLSGLPSSGPWLLTRYPEAITTLELGTSKIVSGLATGTYYFTVTDGISGCVSTASADVIIDPQPVAPAAPVIGTINQPSCAAPLGSVVLNGLPAAGTWTINPGNINGTGSSATISGLVSGTYNFTVTTTTECSSPASADVIIDAQPDIVSAPIIDVITQPTCDVTTGEIELSGLPATGIWSLTMLPGGSTITGTGLTSAFSGLGAGTYRFYVTNEEGCSSVATAEIVIDAQPETPGAPTVVAIIQPTCTVATGSIVLGSLPASGTWTLTQTPNDIIFTGEGTSTTISDIVPGTYTFTVNLSSGCNSLPSADIIIEAQPETPGIPVVGIINQPTCTVSTGDVELSGLPASGTWTINPGGITGTGISTTVTGLANGTHNFTISNADGCESAASDDVVILTAPTATQPSIGTITQPTCNIPEGSVVLENLPESGNWTINPGDITGSGTSTTISGLVAGVYNYTVTNADGCISLASDNVVIDDEFEIPSTPIVGTITQPTCTLATGTVVLNGLPSTGSWTINPGGITGTGIETSIEELAPGTYSFTVTNEAGCTSNAAAEIIIDTPSAAPAAPIVGEIIQPTCSNATGSATLTGLPSLGIWTIEPGGIKNFGTSNTIPNLAPGTYYFTVTDGISGCMSAPSEIVIINPLPYQPNAPVVGAITQPTCSVQTGSVSLSGLPATGTWTINPGNITSIGTSTVISGLATGTHNFTVLSETSDCISEASINVVIETPPSKPATPAVGTIIQPTCSEATGSVTLTGLPPLGIWTISPGNISNFGTVNTIPNLAPGTYNFTVNDGVSGCSSDATADVVITAQPSTPTAPVVTTITHPTCTEETGSVELSGLPATGIWTINPGGISGTGTSTTVAGLNTGSHNFNVTNESGCLSENSANVVINSQPEPPTAPLVGTTTQPTCAVATGSVILSGLPSTGTWTINPGGKTGTGESTTLSNLTTGIYNFTVTNEAGCTSAISAEVLIYNQPATPTTPVVSSITHPTCTVSTGSVILSGLPESGIWTINPGGISGTGSSTTLSGLIPGTYNYTVSNSSGCTSLASANIVINSQPAPPSAPIVSTITQPTCVTATGSVVLTGLPATGTWTINPGAISGSGSSTTLNNLTTGTYSYTVTNADGCTSLASANIVINSQPAAPSAPIVGVVTQPTCAVANGSVILTGLPASGVWTINPGGITGTGTSTLVSNLTVGTYSFTVTNASGCISEASANIVINTQPADPLAPVVGAITQPNCSEATGSVALSGLPATGVWTINPGGKTGNGTMGTVSGLATGTYSFTVTNASGCTSIASADVVINAQPLSPTAPVVGTIMQPTCTVATGSVVLSGLPASGTWTINPGGKTGIGASSIISGLVSGTYNFTVTNASGCTSAASVNAVVNDQPETPQNPIIALNVDVLQSDAVNGNQWYNQDGLITGATGQDYTPTKTGDYYVIVTLNGCSSAASNIIHVEITGSPLININDNLKVYPNPVVNELYIEFTGNTKTLNFEILNSIGQVVFNGTMEERAVVQTSGYTSGIYFLKLRNGETNKTVKIIKR